MNPLPESTIKRQIMRFLRSLPESDWEVSPPGSVAGKPDITGCIKDPRGKGRYVGLEVKKLGGQRSDIVRTRVYLTRRQDWEAVARAHGETFGQVRPVSTFVVVDVD